MGGENANGKEFSARVHQDLYIGWIISEEHRNGRDSYADLRGGYQGYHSDVLVRLQ